MHILGGFWFQNPEANRASLPSAAKNPIPVGESGFNCIVAVAVRGWNFCFSWHGPVRFALAACRTASWTP